MTTAAAGPISEAEERLRNMLAGSSSFQSWTGTATAAAALGKVFLHELPAPAGETYSRDELGWMWPCAVVSTAQDEAFGWQPAAMDVAMAGGLIDCDLYDGIPEELEGNFGEAARRFLNRVGSVLLDLKTLGAQMSSDYLLLSSIGMGRWGPGEIAGHQEMGPFLAARLTVPWGRRG
jgi:hypothetical protein